MDRSTLRTTTFLIKKGLQEQPFWVLTQDEIKQGLNFVIDHVDVMGKDFRDAFMASFRLEHARRALQHEAYDIAVSGAFAALNEECYQCSVNPVKALLALADWVQPNDSDVLTVDHFCQQIDVLEKNGLFVIENSQPFLPQNTESGKKPGIIKSFFYKLFGSKPDAAKP